MEIKLTRYANRKYYSPYHKKYVSYADIREYIQSGGTFTVIDYRGNDITREVLISVLSDVFRLAVDIPNKALLIAIKANLRDIGPTLKSEVTYDL